MESRDSVMGPGEILRLRFSSSYDEFVSRVPSRIILSFFEQSIVDLKKVLGDREFVVYNWLSSYVKIVFFSYMGVELALLVLPLGVTVAAMVLEELIYCGALYFVLVGFSGSLSEALSPWDLLLPTYSVMDDEVFYLYSARKLDIDRERIYTSSMLSGLLCSSMDEKFISYHRGACWTIASPYFEQASKIREYRDKGYLCVDMELASLSAIASYRKVELASLFTISDYLSEDGWTPYFKGKSIKKVRTRLLNIVLDMYSRFI